MTLSHMENNSRVVQLSRSIEMLSRVAASLRNSEGCRAGRVAKQALREGGKAPHTPDSEAKIANANANAKPTEAPDGS